MVPITPEICLTASLLISEYKLFPFDAYHTATAISRDKTILSILSTEHIYNKIKGITRIEPPNSIQKTGGKQGGLRIRVYRVKKVMDFLGSSIYFYLFGKLD